MARQAYPRAETRWTRSDGPLPKERIFQAKEAGRHILEIRNPVQVWDLYCIED